MKVIWAPWRIEYIRMKKPAGCILCDKPQQNNDKENLILYRGKYNFIMMNAYPYNPGHLMIAPYRHIARLEDFNPDELHDHIEVLTIANKVLREVINPDGFNIGINLGKVAGAGIDDHIHSHIVPRFNGDTNYMPVIGDVKVIPEAMAATYDRLKEGFKSA